VPYDAPVVRRCDNHGQQQAQKKCPYAQPGNGAQQPAQVVARAAQLMEYKASPRAPLSQQRSMR